MLRFTVNARTLHRNYGFDKSETNERDERKGINARKLIEKGEGYSIYGIYVRYDTRVNRCYEKKRKKKKKEKVVYPWKLSACVSCIFADMCVAIDDDRFCNVLTASYIS